MTSILSTNRMSSPYASSSLRKKTETTRNDDASPPPLVESVVSLMENLDDDASPLRPLEVPDGCGLLIQLHEEEDDDEKNPSYSLSIDYQVPDRHYPHIHPNCYAPANLQDVHLLYGGGSGTAVFGAALPNGDPIVLKHASAKDMKEVLALVQLSFELQRRGARHLPRRIPQFRCLYISRCHIRDRQQELWATRRSQRLTSTRRNSYSSERNHHPLSASVPPPHPAIQSPPHTARQRRLRIIPLDATECEEEEEEDWDWSVGFNGVDIPIPAPILAAPPTPSLATLAPFFAEFGAELCRQAERHHWKVTLGQSWIGGGQNGADVLTAGRLTGPLREALVQGMLAVLQDLDRLTAPAERPWDRVQRHVAQVRRTQSFHDVTPLMDAFCGKCLRKNFGPAGRFAVLRGLGQEFLYRSLSSPEDAADDEFYLTKAEQIPARFLGQLVHPDFAHRQMELVFVHPPAAMVPLDAMERAGWFDIVQHATQLDPVAMEFIWTCGLTDAGLHNTFLSLDRGLELFDLGEPGLEPRPAFLTKFLMSFFHILGMERDDQNASWKKRFRVVVHQGQERLSLTEETAEKIPYLHDVFTKTLDRIMEHVFDNDPRVRSLMIKYVVLQLLSDAGFCLQRWEAKGGGEPRLGERSHDPLLEKWLWRTLWDIYIASYVHAFLLENGSLEG